MVPIIRLLALTAFFFFCRKAGPERDGAGQTLGLISNLADYIKDGEKRAERRLVDSSVK